MKTSVYLVGSLLISSYITHLCQCGEGADTKKVLVSSTVNSFTTRITSSSVSDGKFNYTSTSITKQYESMSTDASKTGSWNDNISDTNTVDVQQTSEEDNIVINLMKYHSGTSGQNENKVTPQLDIGGSKANSTSLTWNAALTINEFVATKTKTINKVDNFETNVMQNTVQQHDTIAEKVCDILHNIVDPVICIVGILCNVVSLMVLFDAVLSDSPYIYLTSLAIADMGVLVLVLIFNRITGKSKEYAAVAFTTYVFFPVVNIFMDASIWVTCVLTIERIIYIKTPLLARSVCTRKRAKCFIFGIFIFDVLINIPRFFAYRPVCSDGTCNYQATTIMQSELFTYISWSYIVLINVLPLVILLMSNLYMVKLLHISTYKRKQLQPHLDIQNNFSFKGQSANKLTLTLIIIVFLFIVCTFPSTFAEFHVSHTLFGANMNYTEFANTEVYIILSDASNTLLLLNSTLNFLLYCAFNDKFRSVLKSKATYFIKKSKM